MRYLWIGAASALLWTLSGCGGGSSAPESEEVSSQPVSSGISGAVVKGPISGAQVCAYELLSPGKGPLLGCTSTGPDGSYSLSLPFTGEVILEASGGSYVDEATTAMTTLSTPLLSVVTVQAAATATAAITPLTHFAFVQAGTELSTVRFAAAARTVRTAFGLPDLDLVAQLPVVGPDGQGNAYGKALWTVSRALGRGATLQGLAHNVHAASTQAGLRRAEDCSTISNSASAGSVTISATTTSSTETDISVEPAESAAAAFAIDVYGPLPEWRNKLSAGGKPASCTVTVDTDQQVSLTCASGMEPVSLTVLAGGAMTEYVSSSSPDHFVVAGSRVRLAIGPAYTFSTVRLAAGGQISLNAELRVLPSCILNADGSVRSPSQLSAPGATLTTPSATLTANNGSGQLETVVPAGSVTLLNQQQDRPVTGGTITLSPAANISLSSP